MQNKFTKIYETVLETESLVEKQHLHEEILSDEAWEGLGATNLNRTLNLIGMGGAAATVTLGAVFPPAGAIASAATNVYDTAVGTYQAYDAKNEKDPELKNRKTADSIWNFAGAVPLVGDAAQAVRFTRAAGKPIGKALETIGRTLTSGKSQLGIGVAGSFGAQPLADRLSPAPERVADETDAETDDNTDFSDDDFRRRQAELAFSAVQPKRIIGSVNPRGFATSQPLISHFERVAKGLAQNLMEQLDPVGNKPNDVPDPTDEDSQQDADANEKETKRQAEKDKKGNSGKSGKSKPVKAKGSLAYALGLLGLAAPMTIAGVGAGITPMIWGRSGRDKSEPPALGEPGVPTMASDIQNALDRLQGVVGSAGQIAQYAPPGIGELGKRAAAAAIGRA